MGRRQLLLLGKERCKARLNMFAWVLIGCTSSQGPGLMQCNSDMPALSTRCRTPVPITVPKSAASDKKDKNEELWTYQLSLFIGMYIMDIYQWNFTELFGFAVLLFHSIYNRNPSTLLLGMFSKRFAPSQTAEEAVLVSIGSNFQAGPIGLILHISVMLIFGLMRWRTQGAALASRSIGRSLGVFLSASLVTLFFGYGEHMDPVAIQTAVLLLWSLKRNLSSIIFVSGLTASILIALRFKAVSCSWSFTETLTRWSLVACPIFFGLCMKFSQEYLSLLTLKSLATCIYWLICLVSMFYFADLIPKKFQPSRFQLYLSRKLYHFIAFAMFVPVYFFHGEFLKVTLTAALCIFVAVEQARYLSLKQIGDKTAGQLTDYLGRFLTPRETNQKHITAHIYLLAGCWLPVFLGDSSRCNWRGLSGMLSVGIGDAMACLFGIMFGRLPIDSLGFNINKTSGGKTVEGMIGGWAAMCITRLMIRLLPWHPALLMVDFVVSAVEAVNSGSGNDNIVMPLVALMLS